VRPEDRQDTKGEVKPNSGPRDDRLEFRRFGPFILVVGGPATHQTPSALGVGIGWKYTLH
jgi:hypothetical protein